MRTFQCTIRLFFLIFDMKWFRRTNRDVSSSSPRFFMKALGRHAEHCAAISVGGWQITVPIWDCDAGANPLICKWEKLRRKLLNSIRAAQFVVVVFYVGGNNFATTTTVKWNERKNYVPKSLWGARSGTNVLSGNEWINLCDAINYEGNGGNLKLIFGQQKPTKAIEFNDSGSVSEVISFRPLRLMTKGGAELTRGFRLVGDLLAVDINVLSHVL